MSINETYTDNRAHRRVLGGWRLLWLLLVPTVSFAWDINVSVSGQDNLIVEDAVVELLPEVPPTAIPSPSEPHEMRQQNRTFIPFVLAVTKGDQVNFPNFDRTRHHVYSFSPAKPFELKLYVGTPGAPELFDRSGIVALGCNIHDYMQAFIYVAESPFVAVTDDAGKVSFHHLPEGSYQIRVWHPWQTGQLFENAIALPEAGHQLNVTIDLARQAKPSPPPAGFGGFGAGS